MRRFTRYVVFTVAIVVVIALLLFGAITRTDFGRERVRRYALSFLGDVARGTVKVGRIEGNVLGSFTLIDVAIADSAGAPLVQVDRLAAHLDGWGLLESRIALTDVVLSRPRIHLTQSADGTWNYERIFPSDSGSGGDETNGLGDWITMHNVTLRDGDLQVLRPWVPDESLAPAARDSLVREALAGRTRLRIESVEEGLTQHMSFTAINGHIDEAIIADPADRDVRARVDSLALIAAPFNPPPIEVRHFAGSVRAGSDSVSIPDLVLRLPQTHATGKLTYIVASGDFFATLDVPRVAFADVRTLYPPLPDSGTGRMQLQLAMRDSGTSDYIVHQALVATGTARAEGDISISIDSTVRFPEADLRVRRLSSALIEQLVPGLEIPLDGEATGRARFSGSLDAMRIDVNAQVAARRHPAFGVTARGGVGLGKAMTAQRLFVRADRVPLSLLREFDREPPIGGVVTAEGTVGGSMAGRMAGKMSLEHTEGSNLSRAIVEGSVMPRDGNRLDLVANLQRLDLDLLEHFIDSVDVVGQAHGTLRARGPSNNLLAEGDLTLPGRGRMRAEGTVRMIGGDTLDYDARILVRDLAPQAMVPALPIMIVDGETKIAGRGTDPATLRADLDSRLQLFMIDSAEFRDVAVEAHAADGVVRVDTLSARASFGSVTAEGSLGLVEGKSGTMRYHAQVSDLGGLTRWIATGDTGAVPARPAIRARIARLRERADSLRRAERAANDPAAELAADLEQAPGRRRRRRPPIDVPPIGRDSISGSFDVAGVAKGNLEHLDVDATATTPGFVWGGNAVGAGRVVARWMGIGTPNDTVHAEGSVAALRAAGFAFDSTQVKADYHRGEGSAQVVIFPGDTAEYRVDAAYAVRTGEGEVRLRDLRLRLDSTTWRMTRPGAVSWRGQGLTIDSLDLRETGGAHIAINGELPDVDPGRLDVLIERVRIAPWLVILQSDVPIDGLLDLRATWDGTRRDPRIDGTIALAQPTYGGTPFPELHATLAYAAQQGRVDAALRRASGVELATIKGTVPIDLTLGDSVAKRLPESASLALTIQGDSIPLSPLAELTDAVTELNGRAFGRVHVGGTWGKPNFTGGLGLDVPHVRIAANGVLLQNAKAGLRMSGDTLLVDSLVAYSQGSLRGSGSMVFASIANPVLDLAVDLDEARVLDDYRGELLARGRVTAKGPLDTLAVSGNVAVTRGVVYIPDPEQFDVIATDDPAIFALTDTATAQALGLEVPSPVMRNLRLDLDLDVRRGTFGRSPDANVEVYGRLEVRTEPGRETYLVKGALFTDQGTYTFLGKRFDVTRGSVRFLGGEELNPALQILARYEVRQAGRAPLDIRVIIGGMLDRPTVSLESDAQPPLSQSDLIAFLAFGRSSSSLLQFSGTGLEGGGAGGSSLAGNVAALATRQLASVALGALVDEARSSLAARTKADVLNITPADLPAELSGSAFQTLIRGTELEIGKYLDRHTFLIGRIRPSLVVPGASLERRLNERLSVRGMVETRYLSRPPSLSAGLEPRTIQLVGALLTWKIGW